MAVVAELEGKPAFVADQAKAPSTIAVGIKELVDGGLRAVPPLYLRPPHERPASSLLSSTQEVFPHCRIPIIDLTALVCDIGGTARTHVIQEIGRACEEWGFFQVINHGVELAAIEQLREAALKFFDKPAEERMRFSTEAVLDLPVIYKTSFNLAVETVREWRDGLVLSRYPGIYDGFRDAPDLCKKEVVEYMKGVDAIAGKIHKAIFESLGLDEHTEMPEAAAGTIPRVRMTINYYPPCPDPNLTLGVSPHSDAGSLTVLHAGDVPGLEIRHKQTWIPVVPADPSAFIINVADQMEIWTNGKYKSIEHRAVTNRNKPRMSIACFYLPWNETVVAPLPALVDENHPPCFKPTKFGDYIKNVVSRDLLANRGSLDFARV